MGFDSGIKLNSAKTSIKALINTLDNDDFVNIITYSNESRSIMNKNYLQIITEDGN